MYLHIHAHTNFHIIQYADVDVSVRILIIAEALSQVTQVTIGGAVATLISQATSSVTVRTGIQHATAADKMLCYDDMMG